MKRKLVRSIMAAGLAAAMAVTAVGCGDKQNNEEDKGGSDNQSEESDGADDSNEDVGEPNGDYEACTLTISWWGGDDRHMPTQEAIKAFQKEYPGIKIENTYAAWDGWEEKMATAFVAGTAQDVNQVNWNWINQYDKNGEAFLDLNDYAEQIDMSQFDSSYLEMCQIAGTQAAMPVSMTGRIFYWDKTSFDEVGIEVPKSYADLLAAGKAFAEYDDSYYPLALAEYDRTMLMVYYLESKYGDDWVVDGELQYDQAKVEEGLKFIQELEDNHVTPKISKLAGDGAASLDQNQNWIDGHYAGIFEWDSSAGKFAKVLEEGREIVVGDYFSDWGEHKGGFAKVSMGWAINAKTEHPKEAAMLVNFLLNNEAAAEILGSSRGIPASKSALAKAGSVEGLLDPLTVEANGKVLAWCSNELDPMFEDSRLKNSDGVYYDVMAGLSYGDYDISEAAATLIDGINSVIQ